MMRSRRSTLSAGVNRAMIGLGLAYLLLHIGASAEWAELPAASLNRVANWLFLLWLPLVGAWLLLLLTSTKDDRSRQRRQPRTTIPGTAPADSTLWRAPNPDSRWLDTHHDVLSRAERPEHTASACPATPIVPPSQRRPSQWTLSLLRELEWQRFELLCSGFFQALGFEVRVHGRGADRGLELHLYRPGSSDCQAIMYCKSWHARQVGIHRVRTLYDLMAENRVARGGYLTNTAYAHDAIKFAADIGLHLLDDKGLLAQIRALPEQQQQLLLDQITEGDYRTPTCPVCGKKMNLHHNSNGQSIWRCSGYPTCKNRLVIPHQPAEFA